MVPEKKINPTQAENEVEEVLRLIQDDLWAKAEKFVADNYEDKDEDTVAFVYTIMLEGAQTAAWHELFKSVKGKAQ